MKKKTATPARAGRKPAEEQKPPRARETTPRAPRRKPVIRNSGVARIDASIRRYEKATRLAHERAEELSRLAHYIAESAVEKFRVSILGDWAEREFLRDISELRDAFAELAPGSLPERIESLRLLPNDLLQWLESRFNLEPVSEVGKTLEIPLDRLGNYSYDFEPPPERGQLILIRVVSHGWKRNKKLLIPSRIELVHEPRCSGEDAPVQPDGGISPYKPQ